MPKYRFSGDQTQNVQVCRRILLASKERSVWINAFSVARCPIPDVNVNTMSTEAIESLLVRMEIMDAKWSGIRPTVPREIGASSQPSAEHCVSMPPYVLFIDSDSNCDSYRWYRVGNLETPVLEYQHERSIRCHATDPSGNTLIIAYMESPDESPDQEAKTTRLL
jgi:hypothetical protein